MVLQEDVDMAIKFRNKGVVARQYASHRADESGTIDDCTDTSKMKKHNKNFGHPAPRNVAPTWSWTHRTFGYVAPTKWSWTRCTFG